MCLRCSCLVVADMWSLSSPQSPSQRTISLWWERLQRSGDSSWAVASTVLVSVRQDQRSTETIPHPLDPLRPAGVNDLSEKRGPRVMMNTEQQYNAATYFKIRRPIWKLAHKIKWPTSFLKNWLQCIFSLITRLFSTLWNVPFTCMGLPDLRWWIVFQQWLCLAYNDLCRGK